MVKENQKKDEVKKYRNKKQKHEKEDTRKGSNILI